jgi:hypothetical protein
MAVESKPAHEWLLLGVDVLLVLVGVWMINRGWTDFGSTVLVISAVGLVVSAVRLTRAGRQQAKG